MDKAMVMSGYGINSEMETQEVLKRCGMGSDIVHINDLIDKRKKLSDYRLAIFPGGFSYGDDTGAGNAYANRVRNNLWSELKDFLDGDNLVMGICNGFQILVNLGIVPAFAKEYKRETALMPNESGVFQCRFVTIKPVAKNFWTKGIERIHCPVAHGEGNFYCENEVLDKIKQKGMIAFKYVKEDLSPANGEFPYNPNGAIEDIAGIISEDGKVLGLMPHAERAMDLTNQYGWTLLKEQLKREGKRMPKESLNMKLFRNAVEYFR
ncbi:MAG: phosphoribosylformylglycinamidine synthase subunit PurQ [Candidatus Micrarchaeota archaeon]